MSHDFLKATLTAASLTTLVAAKPATFCNPLSIPNYPLGRATRGAVTGDPAGNDTLWLLGHKEPFRELADPTVLRVGTQWVLYPSVDMAWVSDDEGATWKHHPLNIRDIGYAPTVVKHRSRFLLKASGSAIHVSDSPLGPFTSLGKIDFQGMKVPAEIDPMLFSDDDGRLFYYWGCNENEGIYAVELDAENPLKIIGKPTLVIPFSPDRHPWERLGEWNQNPKVGWLEGAWMIRHNGTYYLTYSAAGTQNRTYAMGCYTAKSPLGPFTPQKRNPILRTIEGLATGTAHGCFVKNSVGEIWVFYTIRASVIHGFERRLGMDRAAIDANGELFVPAATSMPQWLCGPIPANQNQATGWLPVNGGAFTIASSTAPNLPGRLAIDNELRTWWQPAEGDLQPTLTSKFSAPATIHATRVVWRDIGMNPAKGAKPGPFQYKIELETAPDTWSCLVDRTTSNEDLIVDYRECPPTTGKRARLVLTGWPTGTTPGVAEFTTFGNIGR